MTEEFFRSDMTINARFISIDLHGRRSDGALSYAQPFNPQLTLESLIQDAKAAIQQDATGEDTVVDSVLLSQFVLTIENTI